MWDNIQRFTRRRSKGAPADITRARALLGWEPKVDFDKGIRETIDYLQSSRLTKSASSGNADAESKALIPFERRVPDELAVGLGLQ